MEPEVHVIEKYFQTNLKCLTMTNVRCKGRKEIDLLAINPRTNEKYHVEVRVGTSPGFQIRTKDTYTFKGRPHKIGLDYFKKEKFEHPYVASKIREIFSDSNYSKVLVAWAVQNEGVIEKGKELGIEIWLMTKILFRLIADEGIVGARDDILRTIEFMSLLMGKHAFKSEEAIEILGTSKRFQSHVLEFIIDRARKEEQSEKANE